MVWTIRGNWDFSNFPGDRPIVLWRINEDHDLVLDNLTVTAPPGRSGDDEDQSQDPGDEGKNADGDPGKPGMNLNIWNNTGSITIRNTVTLSLADGGDGGEATATCATATGGAGAKPGNFRMTAANGIDITNGALVLVPGSGGAGGDATVNKGTPGANGCPGAKGADATATGGPGGENRKRLRVRGNVTGVANISIGLLAGGGGGEAKSQACDGGDGTVCPCDGGPGGAAIATGGPGGEASLDVSGLGVTTAGVKGGDGGPADATGGNGGDGPGCKLDEGGDGGAGGDATAVGGAGGEASGAAATQGAGGDATATSGDGGDGGDSAVLPGTGGDPGTATATGGVDGAGAPSGQETATNGNPGEDGDAIPLLLFCYDFAFLGDFAVFGAVPAGTYTGNLVEAQSQTLLGTMDVDLVDDQGSQYSWQDTPIEHVGFGPGTMRFRFDSIVLEAGDPPPFMAFDIASLYGEGLSQSNPMVVQFLDGTGNVVESHDVTQLPDNTANPRSPEVLSLPIPLEGPQVVEVVMFVPPSAFVTIISVYLLDP